MNIDIEDGLNKKFYFNFEKNIQRILNKIPQEHLFGLHKIQVTSSYPEKHNRDCQGFYYGKNQGEKLPRIVLCANNIFKGIPKPLLLVSFIPRIMLADTLYHEIGHHCQKSRHGIPKHDWEKDADKYAKKMIKDFISDQIILKIILFPLIIIRKIRKMRGRRG